MSGDTQKSHDYQYIDIHNYIIISLTAGAWHDSVSSLWKFSFCSNRCGAFIKKREVSSVRDTHFTSSFLSTWTDAHQRPFHNSQNFTVKKVTFGHGFNLRNKTRWQVWWETWKEKNVKNDAYISIKITVLSSSEV